MDFGFYRVAGIINDLALGDIKHNTQSIIKQMKLATSEHIEVAIFPELSLTGSSNNRLFYNETLIKESHKQLETLIEASKELNTLFSVGLPYRHLSSLYNVMAIIFKGQLLALIPQQYPNSSHFRSGVALTYTNFNGQEIPFGTSILFRNENDHSLLIGVEIGQDFSNIVPPSINHVNAGATLILNGSSHIEIMGEPQKRRELLKAHTYKTKCAYVLSSSGTNESTTDSVFGGHSLISELGDILIESTLFEDESIATEIDTQRLINHRIKDTSLNQTHDSHLIVDFDLEPNNTSLSRKISFEPFKDIADLEYMSSIQAHGLKKRLSHTKTQKTILGLSGGQDSTLALLVIKNTYDLLGLDMKNCIAISMPGLGTTERTFNNAHQLANLLGVTYLEIDIKNSVTQHFKDINHDENKHDIVFENAQARERTQILMDLANQHNGLVVGTGDLSELALGWATYNGDHMSMYGVNSGVPKTLVKELIHFNGQKYTSEIQAILHDILDTPVSPELLPANNGVIAQKTQDIVGPYQLHDFFLYHLIENNFGPQKISFLAHQAFVNDEDINKWLQVFFRRFISQQYKRSALPDGPQVYSISLSPRSGFQFPSDLNSQVWLDELEKI